MIKKTVVIIISFISVNAYAAEQSIISSQPISEPRNQYYTEKKVTDALCGACGLAACTNLFSSVAYYGISGGTFTQAALLATCCCTVQCGCAIPACTMIVCKHCNNRFKLKNKMK